MSSGTSTPPAVVLRRQLPLAVTLGVLTLGLVAVVLGHWRGGCELVAVALFIAAGARMVLTSSAVGLLAVRSRGVDVLCALALGLSVLVLAIVVPSA